MAKNGSVLNPNQKRSGTDRYLDSIGYRTSFRDTLGGRGYTYNQLKRETNYANTRDLQQQAIQREIEARKDPGFFQSVGNTAQGVGGTALNMLGWKQDKRSTFNNITVVAQNTLWASREATNNVWKYSTDMWDSGRFNRKVDQQLKYDKLAMEAKKAGDEDKYKKYQNLTNEYYKEAQAIKANMSDEWFDPDVSNNDIRWNYGSGIAEVGLSTLALFAGPAGISAKLGAKAAIKGGAKQGAKQASKSFVRKNLDKGIGKIRQGTNVVNDKIPEGVKTKGMKFTSGVTEGLGIGPIREAGELGAGQAGLKKVGVNIGKAGATNAITGTPLAIGSMSGEERQEILDGGPGAVAGLASEQFLSGAIFAGGVTSLGAGIAQTRKKKGLNVDDNDFSDNDFGENLQSNNTKTTNEFVGEDISTKSTEDLQQEIKEEAINEETTTVPEAEQTETEKTEGGEKKTGLEKTIDALQEQFNYLAENSPNESRRDIDKEKKGVGFRMAALRRAVQGNPTQNEINNATKKLNTIHEGRKVKVGDEEGVALGQASYGYHKIEFPDGEVRNLKREDFQVEKPKDVKQYLKEQAEKEIKAKAKLYNIPEFEDDVDPEPTSVNKKSSKKQEETPESTVDEEPIESPYDNFDYDFNREMIIHDPTGTLKSNPVIMDISNIDVDTIETAKNELTRNQKEMNKLLKLNGKVIGGDTIDVQPGNGLYDNKFFQTSNKLKENVGNLINKLNTSSEKVDIADVKIELDRITRRAVNSGLVLKNKKVGPTPVLDTIGKKTYEGKTIKNSEKLHAFQEISAFTGDPEEIKAQQVIAQKEQSKSQMADRLRASKRQMRKIKENPTKDYVDPNSIIEKTQTTTSAEDIDNPGNNVLGADKRKPQDAGGKVQNNPESEASDGTRAQTQSMDMSSAKDYSYQLLDGFLQGDVSKSDIDAIIDGTGKVSDMFNKRYSEKINGALRQSGNIRIELAARMAEEYSREGSPIKNDYIADRYKRSLNDIASDSGQTLNQVKSIIDQMNISLEQKIWDKQIAGDREKLMKYSQGRYKETLERIQQDVNNFRTSDIIDDIISNIRCR